jgi:hypothetical protein
MTTAMAVFGAAVGGTSLVCYLLMTRLRKRSADRGPAGDSSGAEGGDDTGGGVRFSNWFGGDNASLDSSGNPTDSGGGDSGGRRRWRWRRRRRGRRLTGARPPT